MGTIANVKLTAKTELAETPAIGDLFYVVDVSDTTEDAAGTSKKVTLANLVAGKASSGANSDITSLAGLTTPLSVPQGGTGAATLDAAGIVDKASAQTLTNKRITPRVVTATDDATAVIDCDVTDQYQLTAVANATEFTVTGTPVNGQKLIIRLKDAGVGKGLTWTGFTAIGVTLPTTTVANKTTYVGAIYNSATPVWDIVAVATEA